MDRGVKAAWAGRSSKCALTGESYACQKESISTHRYGSPRRRASSAAATSVCSYVLQFAGSAGLGFGPPAAHASPLGLAGQSHGL